MNLEKLPESLLNGDYLHCRPVERGMVVEALVFRVEELPSGKLIYCPARLPRSRCSLLEGNLCCYWRTNYITGPGAGQKRDDPWS